MGYGGGIASAEGQARGGTEGVGRSADAPGQERKEPALSQENREAVAQGDPAPEDGRTEEESPGDQGCDGSHHSDTGNGANTDGPDNAYHNTCDGSPSPNGNGGGEAAGKPCAGCVGNADDKNPPGQAPDGSDANNGYECDKKGDPNGGNRGVGVGNPAHTGCEPAPVNPPAAVCVPSAANNFCGNPPPENPTPDSPPPDSPPQPQAVEAQAAAVAAGATVASLTLTRPAEVLGTQIQRGSLASTGNSLGLVEIGAGLLAAGAVLTAATRRRRSPTNATA